MDLDWSPDGEILAVLSSTGGDSYIVSVMARSLTVEELLSSAAIVPSSVAAASDGAVYWQMAGPEATTTLHRGREGQQAQVWTLPRFGLDELEATAGSLIGTEVTAIGAEADDIDLVTVNLDVSGGADVTPFDTRRGAQSLSATPDGSSIAVGRQLVIGGDVRVDVSGAVTWEASMSTAVPDRLALAPDGRSAMVRDAGTSALVWLFPDGSTAATVVGDREVLAFDVAPDGWIAYSPPGGSEVCLHAV